MQARTSRQAFQDSTPDPAAGRWSPEKSNAWYARQPPLIGANYIPSTAINQLEMWQAETFDPATIAAECAQMEALGFNTSRVFLHDLPWRQDATGANARLDEFLAIADRHHIKPLLVLFDSCWDPDPALGTQHSPIPGVHNSGWVQSPGRAALGDPARYPELLGYVDDVVGAFAQDDRILGWDIWNEPDNPNEMSYGARGLNRELRDKNKYVLALLPQAFAAARAARPSQPLTSSVWWGRDWSDPAAMEPIWRVQLDESDIISFHDYGAAADFETRIRQLKAYEARQNGDNAQKTRPLFCTEYMARPTGSTFAAILPVAKAYNVAMTNWGCFQGKSQTEIPWDSWERPYASEPPLWFHDIFRAEKADDGKTVYRLYDPADAGAIRHFMAREETAPTPQAALPERPGFAA